SYSCECFFLVFRKQCSAASRVRRLHKPNLNLRIARTPTHAWPNSKTDTVGCSWSSRTFGEDQSNRNQTGLPRVSQTRAGMIATRANGTQKELILLLGECGRLRGSFAAWSALDKRSTTHGRQLVRYDKAHELVPCRQYRNAVA